MIVSTSKKKPNSLIREEIDDLSDRLNDVELNLVEAKEYSHLSAEALVGLQNQINELKGVLLHLIMNQSGTSQPSKPNHMIYS